METLPQMLAAVTAENPGRIAIVEDETALSFGELNHRILSLAGQLQRLGIRRGDRVAVLLPNGLYFVVSYFAIAVLGVVVVSLNDQYQDVELRRFLAETKASLLITSRLAHDSCQGVLQSYEGSCQLFLIEGREQRSLDEVRFLILVRSKPMLPSCTNSRRAQRDGRS